MNRGHEVHVLHSLDAYRAKRKETKVRSDTRGVSIHTIETRFSRSAYEAYILGTSRPVIKKFHDLVRDAAPDIVHHHNISLLGYEILRKIGEYSNFYTAHDYWIVCPQSNLLKNGRKVCDKPSCTVCGLYFRRPPQLWRYGSSFEDTINQIDMMIAPSDYLREKITARVPIKAVTIPNCVPSPPPRISSSGYSEFMMFAGMLEKHKGVLELLKAYKELAKQSKLKLVIVGDGTLRQKIREIIEQLGLSDRVYLLGWVDRALFYALLRDSVCLAIPSIWPENAPLVALETLSVGTPVVASNLGGLPEIVSRLDNQLVFSWEREGDLSRAIGYCLSNNKQLRQKARRVYLEHFTVESYVSSYLTLLTRMTDAYA